MTALTVQDMTMKRLLKSLLFASAALLALPAAALARTRTRGPMALNLYGYEAWQPPTGALNRRLARRVDAAVAITDVTRQRFLAWAGVPAAQSHVLPCAVDLSCYSPGPAPAALVQRYGLAGRRVLMTLAESLFCQGRGDEARKYVEVAEPVATHRSHRPTTGQGKTFYYLGNWHQQHKRHAEAEQIGRAHV